jgi:F0F1-type ATP synthase membrane subunit c/vacuolar-type H+-ATPase subunit K
MKIRLVVAMANAAVALGLTVAIAGIVGAAGADTAVCAIAGNADTSANTNNTFFIIFLLA